MINKFQITTNAFKINTYLFLLEGDYQWKNEIRDEIIGCFENVSVHGVPFIQSDEEHIDYEMLNQRFNKTLAEIINSIIQKLTTSRKISINGKPTLLNAASIGNITSILIETANNDVSSRFWMEILEKINLILVQTNSKVEYSCSNCD